MWTERPNGQIMGLTLQDLITFHPHNEKPLHGRNNIRRYYCPVHGSDHQRSFRLNMNTGHFKCYSCACWGYIDEINKNLFKPIAQVNDIRVGNQYNHLKGIRLQKIYNELRENFKNPHGIGVRYLESRGIPHQAGIRFGLGYACWGKWPQFNIEGKLARQWKKGRLVFPHTDLKGNVINLYGRAIGTNEEVPKNVRHDHLNMKKGVFNAPALRKKSVILCEGAFDALSFIMAGYNAAAIFGIAGFNVEWLAHVQEVYLAFDDDKGGQDALSYIGIPLIQRYKNIKVNLVLPETYAGCKDANETWIKHRAINIHCSDISRQLKKKKTAFRKTV